MAAAELAGARLRDQRQTIQLRRLFRTEFGIEEYPFVATHHTVTVTRIDSIGAMITAFIISSYEIQQQTSGNKVPRRCSTRDGVG